MMSMDASGTIADTATFSKWKGRNYVRQRVIPSNPQSGPQTGIRAMMKFLSQIWAGLTTGNKATWDTRAALTNISAFNAFTSYNQARWRSFKAPTKQDPAGETGAAANAPTTTATGGIRQVQLSIADGVTPPDWGWIIHRSTVSGFTPGYDNCVAIIPRTGTPTVYIDTPLEADTYYYRIGGFSADGLKNTLEVERSATST
jgi:hypothetical protein